MLISMLFVTPGKGYLEYINWKTLVCLWGLMLSLKGLERENLLKNISIWIVNYARQSRILLFTLVFLCFFASMAMTNDVALIALVPVTLSIIKLYGLEKYAALVIVLETIAANIGSSLTPIGNPQNLYLFSYYRIPMADFLLTTAPIVITGGLLLYFSCLAVPKINFLTVKPAQILRSKKRVLAVYLSFFTLAVLAVFGVISFWLMAAVIFTALLVYNRKLLTMIDYSLLFTFIFIFIFVGNLANITAVNSFISGMTAKNALLTSIVTSQFTSNVPAAVLLSKFTNDAQGLLSGVNIGGMGTLIASMASVISYKLFAASYREQNIYYLKIFTVWNLLFLAVLTAVGIIAANIN